MLIAIVLDRPLADAQALVNTSDAFTEELTTTIQEKKHHLVIAQMIQPDTSEDVCGNIRYFWLVSEESFWLCAYLDERAEVVQCASSALVGRAYAAFGE